MSVTLDKVSGNVGDGNFRGTNGTIWTFTSSSANTNFFSDAGGITVGATFLLVYAIAEAVSAPTIALTWNATSLTQIGSWASNHAGTVWVAAFGLVSPASGNNSLAYTNTGASNLFLFGASFNGSITSSVAAATEGFATNNGGVGGSATLSVSSAVSIPATDAAVTAWQYGSPPLIGFPSDGGTSIDTDASDAISWERYTGSGAVINASATQTASGDFLGAIVGIKSVAAPPTVSVPLGILGFVENEF